jgi:apolipoprotein N-acyltransferase
MQLTSVTGILGPVFAMAWAAAVVNAWWERGWSVRDARRPLAVFALAAAATVAYGSIRLVTADPLVGRTVRVAALAPEPDLDRASRIVGLATPAQRAAASGAVAPLNDDLLARSRREARAGAKIILWSEAGAKILEADEGAFLARASGLARTEGVFLQVGLGTFADDHGKLAAKNRAIMFKPDGTVAWDYAKTHVTPGDVGLRGSGQVPVLDTPYGRLATVICQDDMFPQLTAQAGRLGADILLIPSSDWPAVATWHDRVSAFRAVETGTTVVRATRAGISSVVDPYGTVVARRTGSIGADDPTLVAAVPTHGAPTLYPYLTDVLAFGCLAALLALAAVGLRRSPRARPTGTPDPH